MRSRIKTIKQSFNRNDLCRAFAEQPDYSGVRYTIRQGWTEKAYEGKAIVNQVFCPLIGQVVLHLDHSTELGAVQPLPEDVKPSEKLTEYSDF
ncbi:hypothetical protein GKA01_01230 [Gluconobacter kanchanaburiensis NBRC 103587]|uniref:Uncharacterized protein n=1 Tax=Gluconobacter kanchanaburiensis NBRC 103587 TaxID=1307948 RepID=A0A511B3C6_9PROT|nr:hypothetical protein GKA01_01230 [Gluconobacter kanchanaburiensis NBRC 103587]